MRKRQSIRKLAITPLLLVSLIGCSRISDKEYHFDGKIDNEHVKYHEEQNGISDYLEVIKENGTKIIFYQHFLTSSDRKLNWVSIQKEGEDEPTFYYKKEVLDKSFKKWKDYREKILLEKKEIRLNKNLEDAIKKKEEFGLQKKLINSKIDNLLDEVLEELK